MIILVSKMQVCVVCVIFKYVCIICNRSFKSFICVVDHGSVSHKSYKTNIMSYCRLPVACFAAF